MTKRRQGPYMDGDNRCKHRMPCFGSEEEVEPKGMQKVDEK